MVNQQLADYVKSQREKGVTDEAITSALKGVGWQGSAVAEAMGPAPAAPTVAEDLGANAEAVQSSAAAESVSATFVSDIASPALNSSAAAATAVAEQPLINSGLETKKEFSANPFADAASVSAGPVGGPVGEVSEKKSTFTSEPLSSKKRFPYGVAALSAVSLFFAAAAGYFYMQNSDLSAKLSAALGKLESAQTQGSSDIKEKSRLNDKISSLQSDVEDLTNQLSAFAIAQTPNAAEIPIKMDGILGGGGNSAYSLLTSRNILFTVKNSKNSKVDEILKPLLASKINISGMHAPGSRDITVAAVNGFAVEAYSASAATSSKR